MNESRDVFVIGGSGHAKVVIATLQANGWNILAAVDDDPHKWGKELLGVRIFGPLDHLKGVSEPRGVIAIGVNDTRKAVAERLPGVEWITVIHPKAFVHPSVRIGPGSVVFAGAVIQPDTRIGSHCIVNTSASIDHDCVLEDYVHVAPGARLAGGVRLGSGVFIGIGGAVIPNKSVGAWTTIGAGGTVIRDARDHSVEVGVPARPVRR